MKTVLILLLLISTVPIAEAGPSRCVGIDPWTLSIVNNCGTPDLEDVVAVRGPPDPNGCRPYC